MKKIGDNTLVTMASSHLVADLDLSLGRNVDTDDFVDTRGQIAG